MMIVTKTLVGSLEPAMFVGRSEASRINRGRVVYRFTGLTNVETIFQNSKQSPGNLINGCNTLWCAVRAFVVKVFG